MTFKLVDYNEKMFYLNFPVRSIIMNKLKIVIFEL